MVSIQSALALVGIVVVGGGLFLVAKRFQKGQKDKISFPDTGKSKKTDPLDVKSDLGTKSKIDLTKIIPI